MGRGEETQLHGKPIRCYGAITGNAQPCILAVRAQRTRARSPWAAYQRNSHKESEKISILLTARVGIVVHRL